MIFQCTLVDEILGIMSGNKHCCVTLFATRLPKLPQVQRHKHSIAEFACLVGSFIYYVIS